jgi:outer membrane protein assembly factor BamA
MNFSSTLRHKRTVFSLFAILQIIISCPAISQGIGGGGLSSSRIEGNFKFYPIPYINYNRSIGFSIGALPMAMFNPVKKDTISPSSIVGMLGMYSTNDTWFAMAFGAFFIDEDNWRFVTAGGLGSINFQFYLDNPIDVWVPYNTAADFFYIDAKRRIVDKLYGGVSYVYTKFQTSTDIFTDTLGTRLHGLGLELSMDRRSNLYYPRSGYFANLGYTTYPGAFGNEFVSNKIEMDYNHYVPLNEARDVIASRFYAGLGIGDLSFNQQFIVGRTDIRGYTQGAYRGNYMLAIQSEYRWNFHKRFGAVGFLGLATVFEAINTEDSGKILPGIGTGFRYMVSKDTNMNAGLDIAVGKDDWGIYFKVGEAF